MAAFFPVLVNTHLGAAQVEARYLDVARTLCLRPHRVLLKVILPSAFPTILTGLRLGLIYAWLATIGAEYLFATTTGYDVTDVYVEHITAGATASDPETVLFNGAQVPITHTIEMVPNAGGAAIAMPLDIVPHQGGTANHRRRPHWN